MSELNSVGPEKTVPAKKPVSPARNVIGLVVLVGVLVYGGFEVSAKRTFNNAVNALEARSQDEDKGLMTVQEAENILGKQPNGPAVDFQDGLWHYTTKTYTWPGVLTHYTLTAYYTTEKDSRLHHYETEGKKVELPSTSTAPIPAKKKGEAAPKGESGKTGDTGTASAPRPRSRPIRRVNPPRPATRSPYPKPTLRAIQPPKRNPPRRATKQAHPSPPRTRLRPSRRSRNRTRHRTREAQSPRKRPGLTSRFEIKPENPRSHALRGNGRCAAPRRA